MPTLIPVVEVLRYRIMDLSKYDSIGHSKKATKSVVEEESSSLGGPPNPVMDSCSRVD